MRSLQSISHKITQGEVTQPATEKIVGYLRQFNTTWFPAISQPPLEELGTSEKLLEYVHRLHIYLATRSALENTSVLVAILTFLVILMSSWGGRFGSWGGRFSPFGRNPPPGATQVSDSDYSYITSEDLKRAQERSPSPVESGPPRDRDVLLLKAKRVTYPVHFAAHAISRGELRIGDVRAQAARETDSDVRRIKLLYNGKNLKDDSRSCRAEGLKEGAEIMCVVGEAGAESDSSDSEDDGALDGTAEGETTKRKRVRHKNKKKKGKKSSGPSTPSQNAPAAPSVPVTPLEKLAAIQRVLQGLLPECVQFTTNPPTDRAKKDFDHKRLGETILAQVLLKLDAVETEGDPDARAKRKELVREAQNVLNSLDEANK